MPTITYPSEDYFIKIGTIPDFRFEHVDVKQEAVDAMKLVLPKHNYPDVKVLKSDPLTPSEYPCVGINRISDDESSQILGDVIQEPVYNPVTKLYTVVRGTFFQESLELRVWHMNADERDKLYPLVKATCTALRDKLVYLGLRNIVLRGGKDEQDISMENAPTPLYWASITMSYLNPLNIYIETIEQPIIEGDIMPSITLQQP